MPLDDKDMTLSEAIEEGWGWKLACPVKVLKTNAFGNAIIQDANGVYYRIITEDVSCERIAESPDALAELLDTPEFQLDWNMTKLAAEAETVHGPLAENQCYHLVIPSVLGGRYDTPNIRKIAITECLSFSGDCARQIEGLPDGTEIELKVVEQPDQALR